MTDEPADTEVGAGLRPARPRPRPDVEELAPAEPGPASDAVARLEEVRELLEAVVDHLVEVKAVQAEQSEKVDALAAQADQLTARLDRLASQIDGVPLLRVEGEAARAVNAAATRAMRRAARRRGDVGDGTSVPTSADGDAL